MSAREDVKLPELYHSQEYGNPSPDIVQTQRFLEIERKRNAELDRKLLAALEEMARLTANG